MRVSTHLNNRYLRVLICMFDNHGGAQLKAEYEQKLEELYSEVGLLTTRLSWAKKIWNCSVATNVSLSMIGVTNAICR